jgi:acetolactate synthase-1/2/3 large subunit
MTGLTGEMVVDAEAELEVIIEERFAQVPPFRPGPDVVQVQRAAQLLRQSQRPVLIAGGGVTASQAHAEVVQLAEMLSMPVATSLNAKGTIREDHPLALGIPGTYSRRCANQIVSEADLVLFVGSHTGGQVTHFWQIPRPGTTVIQIDIDPAELGRNYPAEVALCGDAKVTLQRLVENLAPEETGRSGTERRAWAERAGQLVSQWRKELEPRFNSDAVPIRPERICAELAHQLPADAILVSDTGHSGIWTGTMIDLTQPNQRYLRCAGSLGWGLPAAMGVKCAAPERPVICFTGDGGFWYHMDELETAVRCNINTVTIVNNNHSLNQVRSGVNRVYADQPGNSDEMWVFQDLDLARVAESMGCLGIRVERPGSIQSALEQALAADRPVVVDVVSDIDIVAPLPVIPD